MNQRNRVEVITLADKHRVVRLNGNALHKVVAVQHDPEHNSVTITLDADFIATVDDGELQEQRDMELTARVEAARKQITDAYEDGSIIHFRPLDPHNSQWAEAHRVQNPHEFDWDKYEYGLKGVRR